MSWYCTETSCGTSRDPCVYLHNTTPELPAPFPAEDELNIQRVVAQKRSWVLYSQLYTVWNCLWTQLSTCVSGCSNMNEWLWKNIRELLEVEVEVEEYYDICFVKEKTQWIQNLRGEHRDDFPHRVPCNVPLGLINSRLITTQRF